MMDLMYKIPSDETIAKCVITKETVTEHAPALLTTCEEAEKSA